MSDTSPLNDCSASFVMVEMPSQSSHWVLVEEPQVSSTVRRQWTRVSAEQDAAIHREKVRRMEEDLQRQADAMRQLRANVRQDEAHAEAFGSAVAGGNSGPRKTGPFTTIQLEGLDEEQREALAVAKQMEADSAARLLKLRESEELATKHMVNQLRPEERTRSGSVACSCLGASVEIHKPTCHLHKPQSAQ